MDVRSQVLQSAYEQVRYEPSNGSLNERIATAMFRYLREDLGLSESVARERSEREVAREIPRNVCDGLAGYGIGVHGKRVLEIGAGLGALAAELSSRGAKVIAIEPGAGWRALAAPRVAAAGGGLVLGGVGEHLPLPSNSIDLIISLQVLEHVQDPQAVIREAYRVLKPGAYLFLTYENYLSFWEPHYRVRWLPLLPKPIGAAYLRMLGRSPNFLREAITYTTFPTVRKTLMHAGFDCVHRRELKSSFSASDKTSIQWQLLKAMAKVNPNAALEIVAGVSYLRRTFKTLVHEVMQKPLRTQGSL